MTLHILKSRNISDSIVSCSNMIHHMGWKFIHSLFELVCILATIALVFWCCYEFSKDEDVCEVLFKKFHEDQDSIYPDLTFALPNRFNETALKEYDNGFNEMNYFDFLQNSFWDEKMFYIDFEKVSMRLEDFLIQACFYESSMDYYSSKCKGNLIIKRRDYFGLAYFTLRSPSDKTMFKASIKLNTSIFYNGLRPKREFFVFFSYPDNHYLARSTFLYNWPLRRNESTQKYVMRFSLKGMEVFQRRQKKHQRCYGMEDYDGKIRKMIIKKAGCRPPMWTANLSEPFCTTIESWQEVIAEHVDHFHQSTLNKTYLEPCRAIKNVQIDYVEENISSVKETSAEDDEGWFIVEFDLLTNGFKEIKQVRKYNLQSLVGNSGGYIGLCMGFALWNMPTLIRDAWRHMKRVYPSI